MHRETGRRGLITASTRVQHDRVIISIADTGPGIPEEIRERVFEPFFTTKEVGRGTGQGLHLAKDIIDQHHGTILLGSNPGGGTIFTVRLPVA